MSGRPSDHEIATRLRWVAERIRDNPRIEFANGDDSVFDEAANRLAVLARATVAGDDDTAQVAVLRSMLKQNEDVQRTFPEGNWWSEECAALRSAISALEAVAPTSDDVWQCVDRLIGGAYAAGINNVAFDMLAAREALVAALTPSREQGEG